MPAINFSGLQANLNITPVSSPHDNDVSTLETCSAMADLARADASSPTVRNAVDSALKGLTYQSATRKEIAQRVFSWVRSHVRFVADESVLESEFGVDPANELLIAPSVLLQMQTPRGDCDDFSTLTASMLLAAGLPAYFITIKADDASPDRYSHVYVGTELEDGSEYALDTSHGGYAGWEHPTHSGKAKWWVWRSNDMANGMGDVSWTDIIKTGETITGNILQARYAVPQLNPGQYIQNQQGVMYQLNPNQSSLQTIPQIGGNTTTILILAAVGLGLLLVVGRR